MWLSTSLVCPCCKGHLFLMHSDNEIHLECDTIACDYSKMIDIQEVIDNDE